MRYFGWPVILVLVLMGVVEIRRYRWAQRNPDEFPYPLRRLKRRISTSVVFSGIVLLMMYWPKARPALTLGLMGLMLFAVLLGFGLLLLDLRETSQDALKHAATLTQQTSQSLKSILEKKPEKEK